MIQDQHDIEKINRENFRASLEALSRPGERHNIRPLFDSGLLAMASVLLYAEVTYFYRGNLDFNLIEAISGTRPDVTDRSDYLFFETNDPAPIELAKPGTPENPETGATMLFCCDAPSASPTETVITGPGINGEKRVVFPISKAFIEQLMIKNSNFPQGVDVFLIEGNKTLTGLPRTTNIKVVA